MNPRGWSDEETRLRKAICNVAKLCYERNLLVAMDGNLSCLLPSGDILCTKAGCHKGFLTDDDLVVERISGRRSCPTCGAVYNQSLAPPNRDGFCDKDGIALFHRADDEPETVRHRLEVYHRETEPLIAYYEGSRAPVHYIAGDQAVELVQTALREALGVGVGAS